MTIDYIEVGGRLINEMKIVQVIKRFMGDKPTLEIRLEDSSIITVYYDDVKTRRTDFWMISGDVTIHSADLHKTLKGVIGQNDLSKLQR